MHSRSVIGNLLVELLQWAYAVIDVNTHMRTVDPQPLDNIRDIALHMLTDLFKGQLVMLQA